ncbi:hypothetical protein LTR91_024797 [Friedmanniomyces endolithicus]|uniref:Asp/Glu/hydantoin racemase n=1 Tax=Friedmanniomyces endolithicus TaxID=329885 RepID=A0AAN6H257_9PEZI|nr:hypothetical protein LTR57_024857 [Friedmanniomyces endolithicus]KAK0951758.1 hypothetical protein LTR91_024797 [Friedmanniomyces endolithicus]KAK0974712.1 hypothetical protein LTS01_014039 [Friedmanniomyces endolithicus]KAK1024877.1 hypothetical protein LTS16_023671 [Friedmanniomyces endolithicus]
MAAHLPNLSTCIKIGFIVPSSNTALEPLTTALLHSLPRSSSSSNPQIIPLFTRIRVTTVGTDPHSTSQFSPQLLITAAQLLADAQADAILWNGTSGMWVGAGLEADRELARLMAEATGVPCSTTTLAAVAALEKLDVRRLGVAVPYEQGLAERVRGFFGTTGHGWEVVGLATLEPVPGGNLAIAKTGLREIKEVVGRAAGGGAQAVVVACTNWPAAAIIEKVEAGGDVVVVDSIVVTVWQGLRMVGYRELVPGWGRLMAEVV